MKKTLLLLFVVTISFSSAVKSQQLSSDDWKLGIQLWSFHLNTFEEALDKTQSLGIKYIEGFPQQKIGGGVDGTMDFHMDAQTQQKVRQMLKNHGIKMASYGVTDADTEADWVKLFEFARAMELENIVIEPAPEQIPIVSKLADEFKINVAIHNHPKPSMYWNPDIVTTALEGSSSYLGFCADIGHWLESDLDPVGIVRKIRGRVIEFHIKDENRRGIQGNITHPIYGKNGKMDQLASLIYGMQQVAASGIVIVPLGDGVINMAGIMQEMKEQHFKGYLFIEHEHDFQDNVEEVRKGIQWFNARKESML